MATWASAVPEHSHGTACMDACMQRAGGGTHELHGFEEEGGVSAGAGVLKGAVRAHEGRALREEEEEDVRLHVGR